MRITYENDFDNYTLDVSSQNGNYPGTNTQDHRLAKVWRTTALTSATATIDSGTGNTLQPTFAALLNTNLTTGGTFKIQGSSSSGFSSSTEADLTRVSSGFIGGYISLSAKRHWRFLIKDTGSADAYMSAGRLWIGTWFTVQNSVSYDFPEEILDSSLFTIGYGGQMYGDPGIQRKLYTLRAPFVTSTGKAALETFFETVKKSDQFITIFGDTDLSIIDPVYGFKPDNPVFKHLLNDQWECSFSIEEVK